MWNRFLVILDRRKNMQVMLVVTDVLQNVIISNLSQDSQTPVS